MRVHFILSGVAAGLRRNATMTVALVLSTAIALGFVGAAILAYFEVGKFRSAYEDKLNVSVYLCTDSAHDTQVSNNRGFAAEDEPQRPVTCLKGQATTPAQTAHIRALLEQSKYVTGVTYVSEKEAFARGLKQQPTLQKYLHVGDLPASFSVKLRDISRDYGPFAASMSTVTGVDTVNNQIQTIRKLLDLIASVQWFSIVVAVIVLVASVLLIANTIQVAAAQRRNETSIMRLVGASRWMTELPFLLETVLATVIGGLVAFAFISLGKHFVLDDVLGGQTENGVIPNLDVNSLLIAGGIALALGVVLSGITAFVTLRVYVRL